MYIHFVHFQNEHAVAMVTSPITPLFYQMLANVIFFSYFCITVLFTEDSISHLIKCQFPANIVAEGSWELESCEVRRAALQPVGPKDPKPAHGKVSIFICNRPP